MRSVEGDRGRRRPKRRWMDGVREALERRGINGDGRELVGDRMEWRGWFMVGVVRVGYKGISGSDTTPHTDVGKGDRFNIYIYIYIYIYREREREREREN